MNLFARGIKIIKEEGFYPFLKKFFNFFFNFFWQKIDWLLLPYFVIKIKNFNSNSVEEIVNFAFNSICKKISPLQVKGEILELLKILEEKRPKYILEIGTAKGGTLFLFSRISSEDATIISIDLPGGKFGGGYSQWRSFLYKSFALPKQKIHLLRMDSHKEETLEKVKTILNGKKLDFLFIDGDYTYEGVKKDFQMYSPLVEEGGIIAFHDIVWGPKENVGGVPIFWKEIKDRYNFKEIVENWNQGGYGIGVIIEK